MNIQIFTPFHGILSNTGQFSLLNHATDHVHSLCAHCLQHLPASPLQISQKQRGNSIFKVSNMLFHLIAHYDEFFAVNNWGGGQCDWPPPLINLTTHISSQLSPISATLTISDLKTRFHATEWLHTTPLPISTWRACRRPAPLSSLGFTASPTLTRPIKQKSGRRASLFAITAPPVPGSITARQETQLGGHKHGSSSRHLCGPSAARSSSLPSSPTPQPSPNSDMRNCIPTFSPLFIPMRMPQLPPTAPLTCVFRHVWSRPYPLSPFQSNSNTSNPWLTVSTSHAWTRVGTPCRSAHHSFWLPRYSSMLHQFNIKTYTFPLPVPIIPSVTFSTTKFCNFISVFSGSSIILFKFFCKIFKYFEC